MYLNDFLLDVFFSLGFQSDFYELFEKLLGYSFSQIVYYI